jgi:phenylacetate-CoA ligase
VTAPWGGRTSGRLALDRCDQDWIRDRDVETASPGDVQSLASAAWEVQASGIQQRSAFYRAKLKDAGVGDLLKLHLADLASLPFTTKAELKAAIEEDPPFGSHLGVAPEDVKRVYQTSGTTGRPSVIALTRADVRTWSAIGARSYFATGVHPHHSVLSTFGAGPFVAGHTHGVLDAIGVRTVPVGPGDTERVLAALERGLVDTFLSTPSFALYLANLFEERGLDGRAAGLVHFVTGGEPGGGIPGIRSRIEEAFDATVTEAMGLGDVSPSLFGECPFQQGMHFCGTGLVWPEIVEPETGALLAFEEGVVGELVYTSLVREAMPVIRFRSGDLVEIHGTTCECHRTGFRMRCLGRTDDMFIVRGVNVYPSAIQAVVAEFRPRVSGRVRVLLGSPGVAVEPPVPVEVEVPDSTTADPDLPAQIVTAIRSRLTFKTDVTLVSQERFGDAGYKTRMVVRAQP